MCDAGAVGAAFIVSPAFVPCRLERASRARLAWSVENPGSKASKRRTLCTTNSATTLRKLEGRLELRCTRILRYCRLARWRLYPKSHQQRPRSRARPCPEKSIEPANQDSVNTPGANLNVLNSRPSSGRAAGTDVSMTASVRFAGLARSAAAVHCERAAVHFPTRGNNSRVASTVSWASTTSPRQVQDTPVAPSQSPRRRRAAGKVQRVHGSRRHICTCRR